MSARLKKNWKPFGVVALLFAVVVGGLVFAAPERAKAQAATACDNACGDGACSETCVRGTLCTPDAANACQCACMVSTAPPPAESCARGCAATRPFQKNVFLSLGAGFEDYVALDLPLGKVIKIEKVNLRITRRSDDRVNVGLATNFQDPDGEINGATELVWIPVAGGQSYAVGANTFQRIHFDAQAYHKSPTQPLRIYASHSDQGKPVNVVGVITGTIEN